MTGASPRVYTLCHSVGVRQSQQKTDKLALERPLTTEVTVSIKVTNTHTVGL